MKIVKRLLLAMCTLVVLAAPLSACHTVSGMGQDLQAGGNAIAAPVYYSSWDPYYY